VVVPDHVHGNPETALPELAVRITVPVNAPVASTLNSRTSRAVIAMACPFGPVIVRATVQSNRPRQLPSIVSERLVSPCEIVKAVELSWVIWTGSWSVAGVVSQSPSAEVRVKRFRCAVVAAVLRATAGEHDGAEKDREPPNWRCRHHSSCARESLDQELAAGPALSLGLMAGLVCFLGALEVVREP
jgi:hypothetical protein